MLARIRAQAEQMTLKGQQALAAGDQDGYRRSFEAWKTLMKMALALES